MHKIWALRAKSSSTAGLMLCMPVLLLRGRKSNSNVSLKNADFRVTKSPKKIVAKLTCTKTTSPTVTFCDTGKEMRMSPRPKLGRIDSLVTIVTRCRSEKKLIKNPKMEAIKITTNTRKNFEKLGLFAFVAD